MIVENVLITAAGPDNVARSAEADRILRAAWMVLERSHFRSLKIRQVLLASNTSASNFYGRFPSKSHLLLALLEEEAQRSDRVLSGRLARAQDPAAQLRVWLAHHVRVLSVPELAERARLFMDPDLLHDLPEQVRGLHATGTRRLVMVLGEGMRQGVFRDGDPALDAAMVQDLIFGMVASGLTGSLGRSADESLCAVRDFVERALRADTDDRY